MKILYAICLFCLVASCNIEKENKPSVAKTNPFKVDGLTISDTSFSNIRNLLTLDEYIILSNEVPLANIKRVFITEDQIFIFDSEPKIVCYNHGGNVEYKISKKGKGVGEFLKIIDFCIDSQAELLKVYDSSLRKVLYYDINNGAYKFSSYLPIAPHAIANFDNSDFYYNPFNFNYPNSKNYHYSLIISKEKKDFSRKFFPHDPLLSKYLLGGGSNEFPFFYGNNELLYLNRFETTVYSINSKGVSPLFEIELPNQVPQSFIKNKPNAMELIKSGYSSLLTNVYRVNNILYFNFTNEGYMISAFYNLYNKQIVYCGRRIWPEPSKELPVFYPIRGVLGDRFFSLITPAAIIDSRKMNESAFPNELLKIEALDNPIVAFYSVNNER